MQRDHMRKSFEHLGIPLDDFRVLKLLPLIYVAWADGKMEQVKRQRVHDYAMRFLDLSPAGFAVLNRWMDERPAREYIAEGLRDIYLLALAEDDLEVDFSELPALLSYAEALARSTAKQLDQPMAVSKEGDAALSYVARELHIDHGLSWARLLDELGLSKQPAAPRASQSAGRAVE